MIPYFSRREFIRGMGAASALAVLPSALGSAPARRPPNIFLIMADDLGAEALGCYGGKAYATPNMDALARNGVRFSTAWATPVCTPSRAEILTGRYGFRTGWRHLEHATYMNYPLNPVKVLEGNHATFANVLRCTGYKTAVAGKWMLQGTTQNLIRQLDSMGFDEHCVWPIHPDYFPPDTGYQGPNEKVSRYWKPVFLRNGKIRKTADTDFGPDMLTDFLLDFASRQKQEPFLAYYSACLPHWPYPDLPDPKNPGKKRPGGLKANIEYFDTLVGRIVKGLDKAGLRNNTIVMVTGDNGTDEYGKNSLKLERGPRVPFIVNCPGMVPRAKVSPALIDFSDILPTLAELAGAKGLLDNYVLDGKSFAPLLLGKPFKGREWIFSYLDDSRFLRDKRWLLDGRDRFYDCGDRRDGESYRDVTKSNDPAVAAARKRFEKILKGLPETGILKPPPVPAALIKRR